MWNIDLICPFNIIYKTLLYKIPLFRVISFSLLRKTGQLAICLSTCFLLFGLAAFRIPISSAACNVYYISLPKRAGPIPSHASHPMLGRLIDDTYLMPAASSLYPKPPCSWPSGSCLLFHIPFTCDLTVFAASRYVLTKLIFGRCALRDI